MTSINRYMVKTIGLALVAVSCTVLVWALFAESLEGAVGAGGLALLLLAALVRLKQGGDTPDTLSSVQTLTIEDLPCAALTTNDKGVIDSFNETARDILPSSLELGIPVEVFFEHWHTKTTRPEAASEVIKTLLDNPSLIFTDRLEMWDGSLFERDSRPLGQRPGRLWTIRDLRHIADRATDDQQHRALLEEDAARTAELAEQLFLAKAELEDKQRKLEMLANTDGLTELLNRRSFMAHGTAVIASEPKIMSTMMLDIDFFKRVNDTHGHACGDEVIRVFSEIAKDEARDYGEVGRIGGEEFAILLRNCEPPDAVPLAERIRHRVAETPIHFMQSEIRITCSIGIGFWEPGEDTLDASLDRADKALYTAKEMGRNRVVLFERPVGNPKEAA